MRIYVPDLHYIENISIKEPNSAVPTALGGPYFNKLLPAMERKTCAASLTFIVEYGVSLICFMHNFGIS